MTNIRRIFVQIPSYRDPQLVPTLIDIAQQARAPRQLRIVICWQHDAEESIDTFTCQGFQFLSSQSNGPYDVHFLEFIGVQIELIDVPFLEAKGAGWARSIAQQRFEGEKYNLQIDAHHRFVSNWDGQMVAMLEDLRSRSDKPLLTGYPPAFSPASYPSGRQEQSAVMLADEFTPMGIVRFKSVMLPGDGRFSAPLRARFMSGGFVFSDGMFVDEVGQDPNHFFFTEEIVMAVRAHSHGYDFFHPHVPLLWHDYESSAPEVWEDLTEDLKVGGSIAKSADDMAHVSVQHARFLLAIDSPNSVTRSPYGLGSRRSLYHYERFAGLSFSHRGVHRDSLLPGEPDEAHVLLGTKDWESGLICRRMLRISVCLTLIDDIEVHGVEIMMQNHSGAESLVRRLTSTDILALVEQRALTFVRNFSTSPDQLPTKLLLNCRTNHAGAERFFSITADEVSS
jgi:hypothetical protein